MLKPTSIRALNFILYFKIAMILVVLVLSLFLSDAPDDLTAKKIGIIAMNVSIPIIFMIAMLLFIRKRKQFPALITGFVVLWFSNDQLQLLLSVVTILLFFLKSTRNYFRGLNTIDPEPAAAQPVEVVEGEEGEAHALRQPQSRSKKETEVYIREAAPEDADTIHALMLIAFEEYRSAIPPSSALEETEESIHAALLEQREFAAILYEDDTATAMVRFSYVDDAIYFFRLSVIPSRRRRGYARQLVKWIEKQGVSKGMNISRCRVRQSVQNNLVLYQDMGYEIVDQELIVRPAGTVKALTMEKKLGL